MELSLLPALAILIIFQLSLLILFLLTSKKGRRISNVLLASFFFLLLINLMDGFLSFTGFYTRNPQFAHVEDGFVFLLGPVLFFYSRSLIYRDFVFKKSHLPHAIPFLFFTITYLIFYHQQTEEYQEKIQKAIYHRDLPEGFYFSIAVIYSHVIFYIVAASREIKRYRERIKEEFSSIEKINLEWLLFMLFSVAVVLVSSISYTFLPLVGLADFFDPLFLITFIFLFFFVIAVVWKGLRQPEIFAGIETAGRPGVKKYNQAINDSEKNSIQQALIKLMENDNLFLNPEITLEDLAARANFSPKKISQVINDSFDQNFFDFINTYRIREAERIFRENTDSKLTVLEVMYACGFNSKSSFNTIFKQKTGTTPSAYKSQFLGT